MPLLIEQLYRQWRNNSQQQKRQRRFSLGSHHSIRTKVNQQQQQQQLGRDKNGESKQRTEASQQPVVVSSAVPGRCVSEDIGRGLFFYLLAINTVETNERTTVDQQGHNVVLATTNEQASDRSRPVTRQQERAKRTHRPGQATQEPIKGEIN